MNHSNYQIKLQHFEGPFDLLQFFIERDEIDIYDIPITKIIKDFLAYIQALESLDIELSSEFILFVSILIRIKAKMLLPRKEESNQEADPRMELVDRLIEYKQYKEVALKMSELEAIRMKRFKRGNVEKDLASIGERTGEGKEIQNITIFKLLKAFEKVLDNQKHRLNKPVHTVVQYGFTTEECREYLLGFVKADRITSFDKIFDVATNRIHAIFLFLSLLELAQQRFMTILTGEGTNNFVVEWSDEQEVAISKEDIPTNETSDGI